MAWPRRRLRTLSVAAAFLLALAPGCTSPARPPEQPSTAAPSTPAAPIAVYTLDEPVHRTPVTIDWHPASRSFFVGTYHDGTLYRGHLDDPTPRIYLEGRRGQSANGIRVVGDRIFVAGSIYGDIRVYDLETKDVVGRFTTGQDGNLVDLIMTSTGDAWVTDSVRPVLWHLTPDQLATGSGTPGALPLEPEITFGRKDNLTGIVALTDRRFVVDKFTDGSLYRIDLDPQAPNGRSITPIAGATVRQASSMILEGNKLIIADDAGLSVVALNDDASQGTVVAQLRDPSFQDTSSVVRATDRYLVVNAAWDKPGPYTISSVPALQ